VKTPACTKRLKIAFGASGGFFMGLTSV
jgi:hypothetical protein